MKKLTGALVLILGILLYIALYNFDTQVNLFFKNIRFPLLNAILSIITNFGVVITVALIIPSINLYKKNKKAVYLLWLAFIISIVLALIIKLIVSKQRPIGAFTYPITNIINYSFPSMHAMVAFSLLPILIKYFPKQKYFWIIFAFLVAFSRLYFSFHFLSDILFGIPAGYFIGDYLLELNQKKKLWWR